MIHDILTCYYKDFKFYFASRIIYLLLPVYIMMAAAFTFWGTDFYTASSISMEQFFKLQPLLFIIIIPALTMRSIADEYRSRTLEVIISQPIARQTFILGKFLAVWSVCGILLLASCIIWATLAYLLTLDNFWIFCNYISSFIMCGTLCAISLLAATFFNHALGAFAAGLGACFLLNNVNLGWIAGLFTSRSLLASKIAGSFSFSHQYDNMISGQIGVSAVLYFFSLMVAFVWLSGAVLDYKRR